MARNITQRPQNEPLTPEHALWPAFLKFAEAAPRWSFVGQHRDRYTLALWAVFLAGVEAEHQRMQDAT